MEAICILLLTFRFILLSCIPILDALLRNTLCTIYFIASWHGIAYFYKETENQKQGVKA